MALFTKSTHPFTISESHPRSRPISGLPIHRSPDSHWYIPFLYSHHPNSTSPSPLLYASSRISSLGFMSFSWLDYPNTTHYLPVGISIINHEATFGALWAFLIHQHAEPLIIDKYPKLLFTTLTTFNLKLSKSPGLSKEREDPLGGRGHGQHLSKPQLYPNEYALSRVPAPS